MPYTNPVHEGKQWCIYHKNPDGSRGKKAGCSDSKSQAEAYLRRLHMAMAAEHKDILDDWWITQSEMKDICPDCADTMATKGFERVNIKALPAPLKQRLCKAVGHDPGVFTRCMRKRLGPPGGKTEEFCAWLHHECTGKWPGEHKELKDLDEPEAHKMAMRPTQDEANYITYSAEAGKACANCRFYNPDDSYCIIIENYPEAILPTGYCERWEAPPAPAQPEMIIQADSVEIVAGEMELSEPEALPTPEITSPVVASIRTLKNKLLQTFKTESQPQIADGQMSSFKVFKRDGRYMWKAWWSNDFEDREKEIIERAAHDRYLARLDTGLVPMPDLWFWHTKGSVHGKAVWVGRIDHIMAAVGIFDDTPRAQKFIKFYKDLGEGWGVSHGFNYPKWALKEGVYSEYNTFEISPLPMHRAANPYTRFEDIQGVKQMDAERKAALVKALGEKDAEDMISEAEQISKELEAKGITFKDFADVIDAKKAADTDGRPLLAGLLLKLVESQGELITKQEELTKQFTDVQAAHKAELETLQAEKEALAADKARLESEQKLAPPASQADATITEDAKLKAEMEAKVKDIDPYWGELNVPRAGGTPS